jgi:sec-independent protein translocase protein TatB
VLDIGFSEIALIFTLALIVLGPEKLPRVASQVGRWIGRARGMARQFREQLEEEVNLEETRKSRPTAVTPPPSAAAIESPSGTTPAHFDTPEATAASDSTSPTDGTAAYNATSPPATSDETLAPAHAAEVAPFAQPYGSGDASHQPSAEPSQPDYPDHYSHAHPTDSEGRPLPPLTGEQPADGSGQQDWVSGVTATDKPAQSGTAPGYAPSHERGT